MKFWTISEFSLITKQTKRTLQFYDDEEILKAHHRNEVGYRYYSEVELRKLQQIEILKYIGYNLKEIKLILQKNDFDWVNSLKLQISMFQDQITQFQHGINLLTNCIDSYNKNNEIDWLSIASMMDVFKQATSGKYREWLKRHFSGDDIAVFAKMAATQNQKERALITQDRFTRTKALMHLPVNDIRVIDIAKEWLQPTGDYGSNLQLRHKMWELMKSGDIPDGLIPGYEQETVLFMSNVIKILFRTK